MTAKHYFFLHFLGLTLAILLLILLDRMFIRYLGMNENIHVFWMGWIGYFIGRMDVCTELRPSMKTYHDYRDNMIAGILATALVGLPCVYYFL